MLSEKGKTEYIYRCREYELKDYSKIEKFCNSFIDIAIEDKQSDIFDFDNIFFKNKYSTITDAMSYDKKIKELQNQLNSIEDKAKEKREETMQIEDEIRKKENEFTTKIFPQKTNKKFSKTIAQ